MRGWTILMLAIAVCAAPAQAFSSRQCAACNETCDRDTQEADKSCCEKAQGARTSDFCLSDRPSEYSACAKKVVETREACSAGCQRAACAR